MMTALSFSEKVVVKHTTKLFFEKFSCNATFSVPACNNLFRNWRGIKDKDVDGMVDSIINSAKRGALNTCDIGGNFFGEYQRAVAELKIKELDPAVVKAILHRLIEWKSRISTRTESDVLTIYFHTDADMIAFLKSDSLLLDKLSSVCYPKSKEHLKHLLAGKVIGTEYATGYPIKVRTKEGRYTKPDQLAILSVIESNPDHIKCGGGLKKRLGGSGSGSSGRIYLGASTLYLKDDDARLLLILCCPEFIASVEYLVFEDEIRTND